MITDNQVKKLKKYLQQGLSLDLAAAKSGMDEKTGFIRLMSTPAGANDKAVT